jgi:hypothetical protein
MSKCCDYKHHNITFKCEKDTSSRNCISSAISEMIFIVVLCIKEHNFRVGLMSALTCHDRGISSVNPNACNFECRYADSLQYIPPAISECQGTMNTEGV